MAGKSSKWSLLTGKSSVIGYLWDSTANHGAEQTGYVVDSSWSLSFLVVTSELTSPKSQSSGIRTCGDSYPYTNHHSSNVAVRIIEPDSVIRSSCLSLLLIVLLKKAESCMFACVSIKQCKTTIALSVFRF